MHGGAGERDEDSSSAFPLLPFSSSFFSPSLLCLAHLHFLLLLLYSAPSLVSSFIGPGEGVALLELKNALHPESQKGVADWGGEGKEEDPCRWRGVRCRSHRVFHLNVTGSCLPKVESAACVLSDPLPLSIGRLTQLQSLSLPCHRFPGPIPVEIASLKHLRVLDLHGNALHGPIPSALGRLRHLRILNLAGNHLAGKIPPALAACQSLQVLNLAGNMLSGELPAFIGKLFHLKTLSVACNQLHGHVLTEISMEGGHCTSLKYLNLTGNSLTGSIPHTSGNCLQLQSLILASSSPTNRIPTSLAHLSELQLTKMPKNGNLGRKIPLELRKHGPLSLLTLQNPVYYQSSPPSCFPTPSVALRRLEEIGLPFMRSRRLLGPKKDDHFSSVKIAAIAGGCTILLVLIIILCLVHQTKRHFSGGTGNSGGRKEVVTFERVSFNVGYDNIVKATGNFSVNNLIGSGGFGATYRAELTPGTLVAVKRLSRGKFHGVKEFHAEIRTLGRMRHPNLVTLVGYHASESEMFLIYNYLPGGNLESLIHENGRTRGLVSWRIRYKIALDIAHALAYLHHECTPRVLHRDIKPSNILLDNSQNAYLSDFGLARLLGASETHATTDVAGTFGYVAPEYAMTSRVSDKADVYSYGVVLLELLSGKRALDSSFSRYSDGFNIVAWAHHLEERGRAGEVFAPGLWDQGPHPELVDVLKLAVNCTVEALPKRPSMRQVVDWLKRSRLLSSF